MYTPVSDWQVLEAQVRLGFLPLIGDIQMKLHVKTLTKQRATVAKAGSDLNLPILLDFIIAILGAFNDLFDRKGGTS